MCSIYIYAYMCIYVYAHEFDPLTFTLSRHLCAQSLRVEVDIFKVPAGIMYMPTCLGFILLRHLCVLSICLLSRHLCA